MAKFNTPKVERTETNRAGGKAYSRPLNSKFKTEVAELALNAMLKGDSYYESDSARINRAIQLVKNAAGNTEDMLFVAKAIVWGRTKGNLRSISHVLATALIDNVKGQPFVRSALYQAILRPDDAAEILSLYNMIHGVRERNHKIPHAFLKAVRDSFENKWDLYQFRKYQMLNSEVSLRDLVNIAHPRPSHWKKGEEDAFNMILKGTLPAIETAQTVNAGTNDEAVRYDTYYKMIREGKLGYMAMLKALTKIMPKNEADFKVLKELIKDKERILGSHVLPKRFVQAYLAIKAENSNNAFYGKVVKALEKAFIKSTKNVELISEGERALILLDTSGSMGSLDISLSSPIANAKIMTAMAIAALGEENVTVYAWSTETKRIHHEGLSPFRFIESSLPDVGWNTNLHKAFDKAKHDKVAADKILVLTDLQAYGGNAQTAYKEYKKSLGVTPHLVLWNLNAYGTGTPLKVNDKVVEVAGYSDKILEIVGKTAKDPHALIHEIEAVEL